MRAGEPSAPGLGASLRGRPNLSISARVIGNVPAGVIFRADTDDLGLEQAGVPLRDDGHVIFDNFARARRA